MDNSDIMVTLRFEVLISYNPGNFPKYQKRIHHQASDPWWEYVPVQNVFFFDLGQPTPLLRP
jgi:hypothetical protein